MPADRSDGHVFRKGIRSRREVLAHGFVVLQQRLHGTLVADDPVLDDVSVFGQPSSELEILVGDLANDPPIGNCRMAPLGAL